MKILHRPKQLKWAALACSLILVFWWGFCVRYFEGEMHKNVLLFLRGLGPVLLVQYIVTVLVWKIEPRAPTVFRVMGWVFGLTGAAFSYLRSSPALGFWAILFCGYCLAMAMVIEFIFDRPSLYPKMKWYEGTPKWIPHLGGQFSLGHPFWVSHIDHTGVFIFFQEPKEGLRSLGRFESLASLYFKFRDAEYAGRGIPTLVVRENEEYLGMGIEFSSLSHDERKKISDLIESLRGYSYV